MVRDSQARRLITSALTAIVLALTAGLSSPYSGPRVAQTDAAARESDTEILDVLPGGSRVIRSISADVAGDGRADIVALYALPAPAGSPPRASVVVLIAREGGLLPVHLFGTPPADLRGEPVLDPNGSTDLAVWDLSGDGKPEIVLTVTHRFQAPTPQTLLWVFDRDDTTPIDPTGAPRSAPPWQGSGFRLAAFLEGDRVEIGPPDAAGAATLRRTDDERALSGPDPIVRASELYTWRQGGYRLAERALTLPAETAPRAPETAVLGFYEAVGRGDLAAATATLSDDLRASRSTTGTGTPEAAASLELRVEELRLLEDREPRKATSPTVRTVYVRASVANPPAPGHGLAIPSTDTGASVPGGPSARHSFAGVWTVQKDGERWRLTNGNLRETVDIARVAESLPAGSTIAATVAGDLRGTGIEDIAALASRPGRFAFAEPVVIFGRTDGLDPAVPLASFVPEATIGGTSGTIEIADVNADGRHEVVFGGGVGAHSAVLWILGWDGSTLVPLFDAVSNTPGVRLEQLDASGPPEIVLPQSGYCGSYASSPSFSFVMQWDGSAYQSATTRHPAVNDGLDDYVTQVMGASPGDRTWNGARACVQHMLAMAQAFRNRPSETAAAYRAYADLRAQSSTDALQFIRPTYLSEPYVEADLRQAIARAESATGAGGWSPAARAALYDLLGDALAEQARLHRYLAEDAAQRGRADEARDRRQLATAARAASDAAYRTALALDPDDPEARRALGEQDRPY